MFRPSRQRLLYFGTAARPSQGFTVLELLLSGAVAAVLLSVSLGIYPLVRESAKGNRCMVQMRQLVAANHAYAADNNGRYAPAQERRNLVRWHGQRSATSAPFNPGGGFLGPYLGEDGRVKMCPTFVRYLKGNDSFEEGTGGYGYNAAYVGGKPGRFFEPNLLLNINHPARTVMFTDTAFPRADGLQEYPYCEPYRWVGRDGNPRGRLSPSVHFRHRGKANVAWCDGHVTSESPSESRGKNFYGGDNTKHKIGWFGPEAQNGYWNPNADPSIFQR